MSSFINTSTFIGHEREIAFLTNWLTNVDSPIVYIHDASEDKEKKGGIGKTTLLRKFYELVNQEHSNVIPIAMDFFNTSDRDSLVIAERIVQALRMRYPAWTPVNFDKLLKIYYGVARGQKAQMAVLQGKIADALRDDLHELNDQLVRTNTHILLFFDSYELIELDLFIAVLRPGQTFPDNYGSNRIRAIIAGSNAIDWEHKNWVGRGQEVFILALTPFSFDEPIRYLISNSNAYDLSTYPPEILHALYRRAEGRPILLGLVTDVLNTGTTRLEDLVAIDRPSFEARLVDEINYFDSPMKWVILAMSHIYHRFNAAFIDRLISSPGLKGLVPKMPYLGLVKTLPTLSFVRRSGSGEGFVLHNEMRRLINNYCWPNNDPDTRIRRELSKLAIKYYTELIDQEKNVELRQSYVVERLFHELFLDLETGLQSFELHFNYAIDFSLLSFARNLLLEVQKFEPQLSDKQRKVLSLAEVKVQQNEGRGVPAQRLLPLEGLTQEQAIGEDLVQVKKQEGISESDIYVHGSVRGLVYGNLNTVTINFNESKERTVPYFAPPKPRHRLVGRENLLEDLKQKLFRGGSFALSALNGLPGVGKTALALALVYDREVSRHFYDGVLWAGLGREPNIILHLKLWMTALGFSQSQIENLETPEELMLTIHRAIGTRRMLLVIDDAWSPENALAFKLGGPHCAHIVTTRLPKVAEIFAGEASIIVRELPEEESLRLLEQQAPGISRAVSGEIREIIRAVDGLPLPLAIMGNYLRNEMKTEQPRRLRAALDRLVQVKERLQLDQPQGGLERHPSLPEGIPLSQLAVIKISEEALDKEAQQVLRALSIFPPKPNSFSEDAALVVAATNTPVIDSLLDSGLLESSGPTRYTLHQTICDYAQVNLTDTTAYERMVEFFREYVQNHKAERNLLLTFKLT